MLIETKVALLLRTLHMATHPFGMSVVQVIQDFLFFFPFGSIFFFLQMTALIIMYVNRPAIHVSHLPFACWTKLKKHRKVLFVSREVKCVARGEMFRPYLVNRCALSYLPRSQRTRSLALPTGVTAGGASWRADQRNCKCTHCMFRSNDHVQCCGFNILCNYLWGHLSCL